MEDYFGFFETRNVFVPSWYKIRKEGGVLGNVHLEGIAGPYT